MKGKRKFVVSIVSITLASVVSLVAVLKDPANAGGVISSVGIMFASIIAPAMAGMAYENYTERKGGKQ